MATYEAEFLSQHYRHRVRPAAHYSMGRLPLCGAPVPARLADAALHAPVLAGIGKRPAGIAPERVTPSFTGQTLQEWRAPRDRPAADPDDPRTVVL